MTLKFTGKFAVDPNTFDTVFEAFDGATCVTVSASQEVLQDKGEPAVKQKALAKYMPGQTRLTIRTADF